LPEVLAGTVNVQEKLPELPVVNRPEVHELTRVELNVRVTSKEGVNPEPVAVVTVPTEPWVTLRLRKGGPIAKGAGTAAFTPSETLTRYVLAGRTGTGNEQLRSPKEFELVDPDEQVEIVVVPKIIASVALGANPAPVRTTFDPTSPLVGWRETVGRLIV
jgi:hypothetical protein